MYTLFFKRLFDILIGVFALPFVLLVIIIFAPLIYLTDKGPAFYSATRAGKNYRPFKMIKLRSMYVNSPDLKNPDGSTKGGSFTHALGYIVMGKEYLLGRGTGTCYIAELYYDYGYFGILIGSMIYGYIFSLINNFKSTGVFKRSIIFIVITKILWAPRGAFSGFLGFLFAPTTIALLIIVFCGAQMSYTKYKKAAALIKIPKYIQ